MLELRRISKSFPGVRALSEVSLVFRAGEIHGLIGENGAGKSTAIKIMTGVHQPDAGEVLIDGAPVVFRDCRDSLVRGIGFVPQELQMIPDASVAENILLDRLPTRGFGRLDWPAIYREARRHLDRIGLEVSPERPVRGLSAAQQQLIQIAKALSAEARVLLLDEPTSSLTEHEARRLFALLRDLREKGVAVIFVSHKLDEILDLCDRVSVLRDGRLVGGGEARSVSPGELVHLMIGRTAGQERLGRLPPRDGAEVLRAEAVVRRGQTEPISFSLRRGEILGFYGLVGSGRTETARLFIGEEALAAGELFVHGQRFAPKDPSESLYRHRLGYVTENRKEEGLLLEDGVDTNIAMTVWPRLRRALTRSIDRAGEAALARRYIAALEIKTPRAAERVGNLSGGNQQKVSIAKWLAADCEILIIDEPSVGVDVGAKEQIQRLIWNLAEAGKSILLISSDLPELARLASRILVFRRQRIVGEVADIGGGRKTYADISREIAPYLE